MSGASKATSMTKSKKNKRTSLLILLTYEGLGRFRISTVRHHENTILHTVIKIEALARQFNLNSSTS